MRHPLGTLRRPGRTQTVCIAVTVPPMRMRSEFVRELLQVPGREVVFRMREGSIVYARIVEPYHVLRWGCSASEPVKPAEVLSVAVVDGARWDAVRALSYAQSKGVRITSRGTATALFQEVVP